MKDERTKKHVTDEVSAPPFDWLRGELSRRAQEVSFLRERVFPQPVQPWQPAKMMGQPLFAKDVVTVGVFDKERRTCSFYVTQPFEMIGNKLFAGLQPDHACFPEGRAMRLCLCFDAENEIETQLVLTDASEFQMAIDLDPDMARRWAESSKEWQTNPATIPFGLVLRPVRERSDE